MIGLTLGPPICSTVSARGRRGRRPAIPDRALFAGRIDLGDADPSRDRHASACRSPLRRPRARRGGRRRLRHPRTMRQLAVLAFRAPRIGDLCQYIQQRAERGHDNLRIGCLPKNPKSRRSGIPALPEKSILSSMLRIITTTQKSVLNSPGSEPTLASSPDCAASLSTS